VIDGVTGRLTEPRDPESLARAIRETLDSPQALEDYGTKGRARFAAQFTSAAMVKATLASYVA